jgi:hypothetical protein
VNENISFDDSQFKGRKRTYTEVVTGMPMNKFVEK